MKKIILSLVLISVLVLQANAQSSKPLEKKVRFGFKLDLGSSSLSPKESYVSKDGGKFYSSYGFAADFLLSDNYILATGLSVASGGGSFKTLDGHGLRDLAGNGQSNSYTLNLQYLEIPFALKLKTDDINGLKYWGQFGTYLDVNIGARMNGNVDGMIYDKYKPAAVIPINMGLDIGGGVEIPFNNKTYGSFGLGYHNGFVNVTKSDWNVGKIVLNGFFLRTAVFF